MAIEYRGERFAGYSKPKRTPKHKSKSHAVLIKENGKDRGAGIAQKGVRKCKMVKAK